MTKPFSYSDTPVTKPTSFLYKNDKVIGPPEVSIITPFYNSGKAFLETFHCVIHQSFQNFEWIIINDHSTDKESLDLLTELSQTDSRIKLVHNDKNLGVGASRNKGIQKASGNFLFFVDSDDLLEYTVIEKYWIFLTINQAFAFCNAWHYGFAAQTYAWKKGFDVGISLLNENVIQPTFMARKDLFKKVLFDESIRNGLEDWDFWMKCAEAGFWGYTLPEFLYWYRRNPNDDERWKGRDFKAFSSLLKQKYEASLANNFPNLSLTNSQDTNAGNKFSGKEKVNVLKKKGTKRILLFCPYLSEGEADEFNLDLVKGLVENGWEVTIVNTKKDENIGYSGFAKHTSDIFILHNYSEDVFFTDIIKHIISSREPDHILITSPEFAHQIKPLVQLYFPHIPILDYNHSLKKNLIKNEEVLEIQMMLKHQDETLQEGFVQNNRNINILSNELLLFKDHLNKVLKEKENQITSVRQKLDKKNETIINQLTSELNSVKEHLSGEYKNKAELLESIKWYQATYENRRLIGIIKDRIFKLFK